MSRREGTEAAVWIFALLMLARKQRLSLPQLRELARAQRFPDPNTAAAVAMAESGGNPMAVGDVSLGFSIGLWQINLRAHPEYSALALYDPSANAKAALKISSGGMNWQPWTTFRTGAYKKYLPKSTEPNA